MRDTVVLLAACLVTFPVLAGPQEAATLSRQSGGTAMLVMENGKVVFEDYASPNGAITSTPLASGTKSFSSVIAAAAVQDGLLSLDEKAADTLVEWRGDPQKDRITIRQLLSLTSGIDTPKVGNIPTYAEAIALPMQKAPGAGFAYGPANFQIFGEIMRRKLSKAYGGTYRDATDYVQARVLDPIDATPKSWRRGRDGFHRLPAGVSMTAPDWARFGQFILQGGAWNGEQLVDRQTLIEATSVGSRANPAYGLTWWLNEAAPRQVLAQSHTMRTATDLYTNEGRTSLPEDAFFAAGAGKQRLYIIPSRNMVIVRLTAGVTLDRARVSGGKTRSPRERRRAWRARRNEASKRNDSNNFSDVAFLQEVLDQP